MPEVDKLATLSVRAADLADRYEAAGALVVAAPLREIAQEVEEAILGDGTAGATRLDDRGAGPRPPPRYYCQVTRS
jgi:hypothetical protein